MNPCGVVVGKNAYFRIQVLPEDYPDEQIVWEAKGVGEVEFVNGNKGRQVTVRGLKKGKAELTIQIGDAKSIKPSFEIYVVEEKSVDLRVWIIADGDRFPQTMTGVRNMVNDANDIYAQVGVHLNLIEPIVITNIPGAFTPYYDTPQNSTNAWTFDRIVDIASGTGGIECYFVDSFVDNGDTVAANNAYGMILTKLASAATLAHECGHLFGMRDVYFEAEDDDGKKLEVFEKVAFDRTPRDWNNGCVGMSNAGSRYYKYSTSMRSLISKMLMYGISDLDKRDISAGSVYGLWYEWQNDDTKVWHKGLVPTGWDFENKEQFNFHHN